MEDRLLKLESELEALKGNVEKPTTKTTMPKKKKHREKQAPCSVEPSGKLLLV